MPEPTLYLPSLYLDDLRVGQRFTSATHLVTAEALHAFAAQFDPQPFHLDGEAAAASVFRGLAASGWHTAAIAMRLLVDGGLPLADGLIGLGSEISWPRPTRAGDVLQVETEIVAIRPSLTKPDSGIVTARSETRNQRAETVQISTAKLLVRRRPAA